MSDRDDLAWLIEQYAPTLPVPPNKSQERHLRAADVIIAAGWAPKHAAIQTAAATLEALRTMVMQVREIGGLSLRQAADGIGIGSTTLWQFEHGGDVETANAVAMLRWLAERDTDVRRAVAEEIAAAIESYPMGVTRRDCAAIAREIGGTHLLTSSAEDEADDA